MIEGFQLADFERLTSGRRSVRAFLPDMVVRETVKHVLRVTLATPSNCNAQPWFIHVVSGDALQRWSKALLDAASAGNEPDYDIAMAGPFPGKYRERQIDAAVRLFAAQNVARGDAKARQASLFRNYLFFDAPHVALFCVPDWAGPREIADCGQAMQTFMLAATAAGLGTCPQGSLGGYASTSRRILDLPDDQLVLAGVSFGYADDSDATAEVRPPRCELDELVTFHS